MNIGLRCQGARTALLVFLVIALFPSTISAHHILLPLKCALPHPEQAAASNGLRGQAGILSARWQFARGLLHDQKAIWTSPLRINRGDLKWLVPFAALTALTLSTDSKAAAEAGESKDRIEDSREVSRLGSEYATFGAAGAFYLVGRFTHDDRLKETGLLGVKALVNSSIVVTGLKLILGRERPSSNHSQGHFFEGGKSFPSGHAMTAWAFASVVAADYRDKPIVRFGAYAVASLVGLSRFTGQNHFPSDVLVGSALGYMIGRYTVRRFGTSRSGRPLPAIQPYFNPASHAYGLAATFSF